MFLGRSVYKELERFWPCTPDEGTLDQRTRRDAVAFDDVGCVFTDRLRIYHLNVALPTLPRRVASRDPTAISRSTAPQVQAPLRRCGALIRIAPSRLRSCDPWSGAPSPSQRPAARTEPHSSRRLACGLAGSLSLQRSNPRIHLTIPCRHGSCTLSPPACCKINPWYSNHRGARPAPAAAFGGTGDCR